MTVYMDFLQEESEKVNKALEIFLNEKIKQVNEYSLSHKQYYENIKEYIMRGGKRLRPVFLVLGYKAIKEDVGSINLYRAACSVEILHNGSLIHDDLIDHDEKRRGGKTFHLIYRDLQYENGCDPQKSKDFGIAMAILGGDSLFNLGAEAITASKLEPEVNEICQQYYQHSFGELVDGVLMEMNMNTEPTCTIQKYLKMIEMKTATLFERSLMIGAVIAGATQSQLDALKEFGIKVGQAFQIQDDILGSFGKESKTGKSASGDIREGKKTILFFESYTRATSEQRRELNELLSKKEMTDQEVDSVKNIFVKSGALEASRKRMTKLLKSAQDALDSARPSLIPYYKELLIWVSNFLIQREY